MIDWAKVQNAEAPPASGREIYHVRVSEICPNGLFSVVNLSEYLQETAYRNSTLLNLGMEALKGTPLAWVIARLNLHVRHYPRKGDAVAVETWYAGIQSRFGLRFYRLKDENNVVIAAAISTFALFDLESREIAEWPPFIQARMPEPGPQPMDFQRRKIERPLLGMPQAPFSPRLGDIDINNHVNNTKLVEWALSAATENVKHPFQPRAIDIVFRNECKLQDTVQAEVQQLSEQASGVLLSTADNREIIRAHITR